MSGGPDLEGSEPDESDEEDRGAGQEGSRRSDTDDEVLRCPGRCLGCRVSFPLSRGTPIARTHKVVIVAIREDFSRAGGLDICSTPDVDPRPRNVRSLRLQIAEGIGRLAVDPDLEVNVRAEAVAGAVAESDDLALGHPLSN